MSLRSVAVIGAGAAGLCAARHVLDRPGLFSAPVVYEAAADVGGTWVYQEWVGNHGNGRAVHSSMYRDLRTNLPKEVMMFPDFPFDPELDSFLPHQEVRKYLEKYCQYFHIRPHIRFKTEVERVKPVVTTTGNRKLRTVWKVTSSDETGSERTERFDSVFVCSGHYSEPNIPQINGIQHFKGQVIHSHSYRSPEQFSDQSVVVLGAKASGIDISLELASVGAKVTLSHGLPRLSFPLPSNVRQSFPIEAVRPNGDILFQDGSSVSADVLLLCTGYNFSFPFLRGPELGVLIESQLVGPLYRLLMPPAWPSLFFIGLCQIICPFPHFHCQVQFALSVLSGSVSLPSHERREAEARGWREEQLKRGVEERHLLKLDQEQWEYCRGLALDAGFAPIAPVVRQLYEEVWRQRRVHPQLYRTHNYRLVSEEQWERLHRTGHKL